MGAVEQRGARRNFVERLDEHDAALAEAVDDGLVVDDLVIDVQRRAEEFECPLEAFDRHVDAGAEARGLARMIFIAFEAPVSWSSDGPILCVSPLGGKARRVGRTFSAIVRRHE